jgi:hypothetical protein
VEDRAGHVSADRVLEGVRGGVRLAVLDGLLHLDADDGEATIPVALVDRAQRRGLELAGWAPAGPEVDPDRLATEVFEADRRAVEVGQHDAAIGPVTLECRSEIAQGETGDRRADEERRGIRDRQARRGRAERHGGERPQDRGTHHRDDRDRHLAQAERPHAAAADAARRQVEALGWQGLARAWVGQRSLRSGC